MKEIGEMEICPSLTEVESTFCSVLFLSPHFTCVRRLLGVQIVASLDFRLREFFPNS